MTDRAPEWRFILCGGCCDAAEALAQEIGAVSSGRAVHIASCLSVCKSPATLAAQGEGRATYVFAGIEAGDVADIAAFARAYDAAPHGWIADARPLGRLRFKLVTRVPAATDPQLKPPA
ncbi:MAG: DUF1636 family protein [Rhodobacteraceae bacterium]|nr:DUF1636 family protein [Paracoccaceae bacterium]